MIKTMSYKIKKEDALYDLLQDLQYATFKMRNKAVTMAWDWQGFSFSYKSRFDRWPREKHTIGQSLKQDIYHHVKEWNEGFNSLFCDASIKEALDKFKREKKNILTGKQSIFTYKKEGAYTIRASQIRHLRKIKKGEYVADFSLLSPSKAKELHRSTQVKATLNSGGTADVILDRIIEGTYQLSDCKITYNRKKKQFFLLVSYQFEKQPVFKQPGRVMGVDLGIRNPATIAIPDVPYAVQFVGNSQEVQAFEKQTNHRIKQLQRARKWAGEGSRGHGTKTRIKPITNIKQTVSKYKEGKNHQWSRYIIDYAVQNSVECIQMEDLTDISTTNKFLQNWTYYDLQQKIQRKAGEVGIDVIYIPPQHTSARCHRCGAIHRSKDQSIWRRRLDTFHCMVCDYQGDADVNAAKNIGMNNIETIIEEERENWKQQFENKLNQKKVRN